MNSESRVFVERLKRAVGVGVAREEGGRKVAFES